MFEQASKMKLRFETLKGYVTVEDLWDVPLTGNGANLDYIAKELYKKLNVETVHSFVVKAQQPDATTQLRFDIVTHIIHKRLEASEKAEQLLVVKEKKRRIMGLIVAAEDREDSQKSKEDLLKMLDDL